MIKKILKIVGIIFIALIALSFYLDDEEETGETRAENNISQHETSSKTDLTVSDFKLNAGISKTVKMLKSKGWKAGDGEDGGMLSEYSSYLSAYGYEKPRGKFEDYNVSFVQIASDEYDKLAHYRIKINTSIDTNEMKRIATEKGIEEAKKYVDENRNAFFCDIQKKCLTKYGYSTYKEENEEYRGSYTFGFKNKNGDICKMNVKITDSAPIYAGEDYTFGTLFTLDYVSARYRKEEKLARDLMRASGRYGGR